MRQAAQTVIDATERMQAAEHAARELMTQLQAATGRRIELESELAAMQQDAEECQVCCRMLPVG